MKGINKTLIYSSVAVVGAVALYFLLTKKKEKPVTALDTQSSEEETGEVTTSTGDVIEQEQAILPPNLAEILKQSAELVTVQLKNKPVYSKVDEINVRDENFVNNGIVNNIISTISNKDTYLGTVISVVEDKGKLKNNQGRVYKWFKIKPSKEALDDMKKNKGFFDIMVNIREIFIREDVIKL
jgi:hypothetical protein